MTCKKWSDILEISGFDFARPCLILMFEYDIKYEKYKEILGWHMVEIPKELITDENDSCYITIMSNN